MRVAINGFGRIGRSVFRVLNNRNDIDVVAINDIFDKGALTYLLKYDTVMGRFPGEISLDSNILHAGNQKVKLCLLYTSPSPRDVEESRMPSSA